MPRLLIVLFLCFVLLGNSCGQKPKEQRPKSALITNSTDSIDHALKDTALIPHLIKLYGDSILIVVDSLLKDSSFSYSINEASLLNFTEHIPLAYTNRFPIKSLGWTRDFEHIFTPAQIVILDSIITGYEKETSNEIAIATIDKSWITAEEFDDLILSIHNTWGIGKKNSNNGIVIGISTGLKRIRISNGYGIEQKLTDAETKKIIDEIILPEFKQANFYEGTIKGLLTLMQKLGNR